MDNSGAMSTPPPLGSHERPSLPASPLPKHSKVTIMSSATESNTESRAHLAPPPPVSAIPPLLVQKLSSSGRTPTRGSAFAAGYDLYAARDCVIASRGKALVDTDIAIALTEGCCEKGPYPCLMNSLNCPRAIPSLTFCSLDGRIAPRSGLASKYFIDTGAGVIDSDYRGPLKVLLFNHAETDFEVKEGDRVAQLIIERIYSPEVQVVEKLEESVRGVGGFGSTG